MPDPETSHLTRGLYYLDEAAAMVAMCKDGLGPRIGYLSGRSLAGWSRRGFFPLSKNPHARNRRYMRFGALITSRAIAVLIGQGAFLEHIKAFHDHIGRTPEEPFPFATRKFWGNLSDITADLVPDFAGHLPLPSSMIFDEEGAVSTWEPDVGVRVDPLVMSGTGCLSGTRIPTETIYGAYLAGASNELIAQCFRCSEAEVQTAIDWEESLECYLSGGGSDLTPPNET